MMRTWACTAAGLILLLGPSPAAAGLDEKLKPEEIVARHLAALGKPHVVRSVRNRVINGTARATIQVGGAGFIEGKTSILSKGPQTRIGMIFPAQDYPGEHFAYNGDRVTVGWLTPGVRSALSTFIYQNEALLREGILGGVLTTAWPLAAMEVRRPRLSYGGLQKIDEKKHQTLRYRPRKGGMDVEVTLYFEPETFRHVRTVSKMQIGAQIVPDINQSARQQESRYELVEDFADFREFDGLMLPGSYKIQYTVLTMGRTILSTWTLELQEYFHNQEFDDGFFVVE